MCGPAPWHYQSTLHVKQSTPFGASAQPSHPHISPRFRDALRIHFPCAPEPHPTPYCLQFPCTRTAAVAPPFGITAFPKSVHRDTLTALPLVWPARPHSPLPNLRSPVPPARRTLPSHRWPAHTAVVRPSPYEASARRNSRSCNCELDRAHQCRQ